MIAAGVTDIASCVDVMEETLVLLARGDYRMAGLNSNSHGAMITFPQAPEFDGMPKDGPDRRFMAMPAYLGGRFNNAGVKWYGSNAENRNSGLPRSIHTFVLNDTVTGAPKAIMSGNLLSAYRTGAVPGVGVKHLAVKSATTLAIIGPGVMGKTITQACLALRPGIDTIKVKGRSARGVEEFRAWAAEKYPQVSVVAVDSEQDAAADADIIVAATTTDAAGSAAFPYFRKDWLKPGALLLLPAAARFDDQFITGDARLVVDYMGLYDAWAEEYGSQAYQLLGIPGTHWHDLMTAGILDPGRIRQIGDICEGILPARLNDDEIILYSVGGMPVEDVAWATQVYENAVEEGIGTRLTLWDEPALA
ncbi:tyramine oxidase subunit B [Corynebacterium pacaense]|uniref:tyramine oxidase subunit B n=1 Tax=Corynebacterium pacaense TaxID=1816684 RepID=UPI001FE3BF97|nr:tyramine oxidase subunit B [Corynebacterium pacaense]